MRVGRLTKAHGLKGAIKVELYTDEPERRFVPGASFALQVPTSSKWHGKRLELAELRVYNGSPVAFFVGVGDRTEAESLVKAVLWVEQDARELPAEPDAWYVHQLAGLDVVRDGEVIGRVIRVDAMPAQDLLAIQYEGREVLLPFVKEFVPEVDLQSSRIVIAPPGGLFEDLDGEDPEPAAGDEPVGPVEAVEPAEPVVDDAPGADSTVDAAAEPSDADDDR